MQGSAGVSPWSTFIYFLAESDKEPGILIHRCSAGVSPPTLLIGDNVVKVVPRVRSASSYACYESVICGPGLQGVEFSDA
jgi:hypothetical protein